ncbi:hypothetical protein [Caulobacter sp.]|uniref:hypothetical protein n=1 Tax=Caulobacter sp. TaxID=78 RepID=UPI001B1CAE9B|nr:hypothetical protein [Caulobacter sp.]MBO9545138.1 hypothetical protein [Caulobacter sp.]
MSAENLAEPNPQRRRLTFSAAALALIPGLPATAATDEAVRLTTIFDALRAEGRGRRSQSVCHLAECRRLSRRAGGPVQKHGFYGQLGEEGRAEEPGDDQPDAKSDRDQGFADSR